MNLIAHSARPPEEAAFEQVFRTHYRALHAYGVLLVKDADTASELVQQLFLKLWERRGTWQAQTSVKAYLYKCVYHDALNYLKHQKVKEKYEDFTARSSERSDAAADVRLNLSELQQRLASALNELPEQCRTIFQLSRYEELRYMEIAEQLNISVKTVENQMGKALRLLRVKLADFLILLLSVWFFTDH